MMSGGRLGFRLLLGWRWEVWERFAGFGGWRGCCRGVDGLGLKTNRRRRRLCRLVVGSRFHHVRRRSLLVRLVGL